MKSFLLDLLILIAISAVVAAVMLLPKSQRRLEKNWGEVYYDAPVTKNEATKVLNALVNSGLYNGETELTHSLRKVGGSSSQPETFVWAMVYDRNYREVLGREIIIGAIQQLHAHVFLNQRSTVELVDEVIATDDVTEQVDQDWGSVLFDSPIAKLDASRFAQAITETGGYNGSIHMIPNGRSITYRVERDPASLEAARSVVANAMQGMVHSTFPEDPVQVVLVDQDLKQFEVLVEPIQANSQSEK